MSTTTKFSGPWHVITDSQGYDNIHHAPADDGDTGDIVATCFQDSDHARLIAAAPELYTACQYIVDAAENGDEMTAVEMATAALSKARGEA